MANNKVTAHLQYRSVQGVLLSEAEVTLPLDELVENLNQLVFPFLERVYMVRIFTPDGVITDVVRPQSAVEIINRRDAARG